ncbi:hypothetical protein VC83_07303 [Pseudogymnoascus destructans]|uniref:Uncharacterized protein n=2 Tax=Pseudogymnoascus destructans TaxID=655981 RepID=L8FU81_PSED2|nr:uncharacterized protein VC83_07303 [Pseudogymnoascus destructans]ELR03296.1 hypothetical protein GMDG_06044 [Pseudogymnoascus destructans 20631-21]OAF56592.1 hypothetical protein VC83_07303 [Pseudogymnoascus destructans]
MAPQDQHGSGSKPVRSKPGKYRIKSSLFRQPPLVPDAHDADPIFTNIFSNRDQLSISNPSGPVPTNSTYLSSDSSISFRRERLGLYVQNYAPPPEPQYKGLQAARREPQPKPEPKPIDWGGWDIPEPKPNNVDENDEPVLWGGAPAGDNSVKWAPTSGKGKKKNKSKASRFQGHFLEPPVARIKVDIHEKGVKWRTSTINGGPGTGLGDTAVGFMPWETPETDEGRNCIDTEMTGVNTSSVARNADGRNAHDGHQRPGFYFLEPRREQFVLEVSDDEEENSAGDEDEDEDEGVM